MKNLRKSTFAYLPNVDRMVVEFYNEEGHVVASHSNVVSIQEAARLEEFWRTWTMRSKFLACSGPARVTV